MKISVLHQDMRAALSGAYHLQGGIEKNEPYFPPQEVKQCRRDFKAFVRSFPESAIQALMKALSEGRLNGSFVHSDAIYFIAEALKRERAQVYRLAGRRPEDEHPFEFWFKQIGGWRTVAKKRAECSPFEQKAIEWCREVLNKRRRRSEIKQRPKEDFCI